MKPYLISFLIHCLVLLPLMINISPKKRHINLRSSILEREIIAVSSLKKPELILIQSSQTQDKNPSDFQIPTPSPKTAPATAATQSPIPKTPPQPPAPKTLPSKPQNKSSPKPKKSDANQKEVESAKANELQKRREALKKLQVAQSLTQNSSEPSCTHHFQPIKLSLESDGCALNDYESLLMTCIQEALTLPEKGEVKVKLTLSKTGSVLSLKILKSSSKKNHAYVENTLGSLTFPQFQDAKQKSFDLLLENL